MGENGHAVIMGQKISADSMRIGGQRFFLLFFAETIPRGGRKL